MPTIRRRGNRYQAQVRKAGAEPHSRTFPTKAAAERWARRLEADIDDGRARTGLSVTGTIADLIDRYERDPVVIGKRPIGRTKASSLGILKRQLGHIRVRNLDAGAMIRFARTRSDEGAGRVTIAVDLSYLGTVLRTARALWRLSVTDEPVREARDALRMVGLIGRSHSRERRPTQAELERLVGVWRENELQQIPMADIVEFAIAGAMRLGEICRIRWADLDAVARTVIIRDRKDPRAKAGNDEVIPLLDVTGYDALGIILRQPRTENAIFPCKPQSVSRAFARGCERAGIADLTFHDLRHEGVSRLFEAGLRIEQVALISGHKDWKTLRRYTQLRPRDLTAAFPLGSHGATAGPRREGR